MQALARCSELDSGRFFWSNDTMEPDLLRAAETLWRYHCIYDPLQPADIIVGLGSYDLRVADRCANLYRQGLAPKILFTGHEGHWTRDRFDTSEARAFADQAINRGIPSRSILLEERATNIGENISYAAEIAGSNATAILVTKPQTQRRCHATAKKQWPRATTFVTAPLHAFEHQPTADFALSHLICEMVGDLNRIRIYPEAGFQIPQDIPDEVANAFDLLVENGFTSHL